MPVRNLETQDLGALLKLLTQQDDNPQYRTMAPESRSLEDLELELTDASPFREMVPFVLEGKGTMQAYVGLCDYEGEIYLEGPVIDSGVSAETVAPLIKRAVQEARERGYGFIEAFVDEENKTAQAALRFGGFEPFRTTYIYEIPRERAPVVSEHPSFRVTNVGEIESEDYRELYRETSDNWATRLAWTDEEIRGRFREDDVQLFLAYDGDKPVGHLELEFLPEDGIAEIAYFGVLPTARGQGLARVLLARGVEAAFKDENIHLVLARAHDDERSASHALEKDGFTLSHAVVAFTLELDEGLE